MSKTRGIIMMRKITIMKRAGRLLSNIELIIVVELTTDAFVVEGNGGGGLATRILEIFCCKFFVILVSTSVAFSN
jgi:hypothetical protein